MPLKHPIGSEIALHIRHGCFDEVLRFTHVYLTDTVPTFFSISSHCFPISTAKSGTNPFFPLITGTHRLRRHRPPPTRRSPQHLLHQHQRLQPLHSRSSQRLQLLRRRPLRLTHGLRSRRL